MEFAKLMEHQCATIEELLAKVITECEIRGYSTAEMCKVCDDVKAWYVTVQDFRAGIRDCKGSIYDKWYRYNRRDDGAAYDKGWMQQNKSTQCEKVTFLNTY